MSNLRTATDIFWSIKLAFSGLLMALGLAACSRTVTWEEEVPLNTGETILVLRSMKWAPLGSQGNPFDVALRPTRDQTILFTYRAKQFTYAGRADVNWIAISPSSEGPVLVAPAASFAWDKEHQFRCVVPHYVQLVPDASGQNWSWPETIEPWLYYLPANVMASIPALNEMGKRRYTRQERDDRDSTYRRQFPPGALVDPFYEQNGCIAKSRPKERQHDRREE